MGTPTPDAVRSAIWELAEVLPLPPGPSHTSLDLAEVQNRLARATFTVLAGSSPGEAFDALARYCDKAELVNWLGNTRAEVIVELVASQSGANLSSSWLAGYGLELRDLGSQPDRRWLAICARLCADFPGVEINGVHHPHALASSAAAIIAGLGAH